MLFINGEELVGTIDHPVWSADRYDWIGLGALTPGEHVRSRDGLLAVLSGPMPMIVGEVLSSERLEFDAPNETLHVSLLQLSGK